MGVFELVFLIIFWTWVVSSVAFLCNTFLPRYPISLPYTFKNLALETVHFKSTDGLHLEGWKVRTDPNRPWIILCHGLGSNRSDLLDIASRLRSANFNLFLFDFRGHGGSAGRTTSFGWQEQYDLEGALVYLGSQADVTAQTYGIYGISMGGSVAIMVAARDERLGAIATESPYANLQSTLLHNMKLLYRAPKIPFLWFIAITYRLRFKVWPKHVSPMQSAGRLSPRSLLLIHGQNDTREPIQQAKDIFASAGSPKEFWNINDADHLEGFQIDPELYVRRLAGFFESNLT